MEGSERAPVGKNGVKEQTMAEAERGHDATAPSNLGKVIKSNSGEHTVARNQPQHTNAATSVAPLSMYDRHRLTLDADGYVRSEEQRREERIAKGLCPTCVGEPTKCFKIRKSALKHLIVTRKPLTVPGKVKEGVCLLCNPNSSSGLPPTVAEKTTKNAAPSAVPPADRLLKATDDMAENVISNDVPPAKLEASVFPHHTPNERELQQTTSLSSTPSSEPSPPIDLAISSDSQPQSDLLNRIEAMERDLGIDERLSRLLYIEKTLKIDASNPSEPLEDRVDRVHQICRNRRNTAAIIEAMGIGRAMEGLHFDVSDSDFSETPT